jgi:hypothetical protein
MTHLLKYMLHRLLENKLMQQYFNIEEGSLLTNFHIHQVVLGVLLNFEHKEY